MVHEVAILGAGELGGMLAHVLARRDIVSKIRLIDETGQIAAGTALDIMQASPIEGFATMVCGSPDLTTTAAASVVVIADRAHGGEWRGDDGLLLLERISQLAATSLIVCAGASQLELVERGVRELRFLRTRLFGSAPEALVGAIRAIVALEANGSARDVALSVLGIPPDQAVVPWEEATIGGFAATRLLDEPTRRRIAARVGPLWPPGPHALATAAAEAIAGLVGRSHRTLSCFVAPDDSNGRKARAVALPVHLSPDGIQATELPPLAVQARVALDKAMLL